MAFACLSPEPATSGYDFAARGHGHSRPRPAPVNGKQVELGQWRPAPTGYLSKYATKATEVTGHTFARLTGETIDIYANPDGSHTERLVDACWTLGHAAGWQSVCRWAHMLGLGGHFLTKSRHYSVTFWLLRQTRVTYQREHTTGPEQETAAEQPTTLVVNLLQFIARNVAKLVQVESPDYDVGRGLTIDQARGLLEVVAGTRWHSLYVLALMLGLRRGELLGLGGQMSTLSLAR